MDEMPPETTIELDIPRLTDYLFSELFGGQEADKIEFPIDDLTIQNQGATARTKMACSRYGMIHIVNGNNLLAGELVQLSASDYWDDYLKVNPAALQEGATLQSALDQFRKNGNITGYSKVVTVDEGKKALDQGQWIYTGAKNGNWAKVRDEHEFAFRTGGSAHIFCIVGYDNYGFIAINSYGEDNGVFIIPFDLFESLFTRYAITSPRYEDIIRNHKKTMDETMIKKTVDSGLMSDTRREGNITRKEAMIVFGRLLEMLSK